MSRFDWHPADDGIVQRRNRIAPAIGKREARIAAARRVDAINASSQNASDATSAGDRAAAHASAQTAEKKSGGLMDSRDTMCRASPLCAKQICLGNRQIVASNGDPQVVVDSQRDSVIQGQVQFAIVNQVLQSSIRQTRSGDMRSRVGRKHVGKTTVFQVVKANWLTMLRCLWILLTVGGPGKKQNQERNCRERPPTLRSCQHAYPRSLPN